MPYLTLVCPLWRPPHPPSIEEQMRMGAAARRFWQNTEPTCLFTNGEETDAWTDRWTDQAASTIARDWRCATHQRRPRTYSRYWNAQALQNRMAREHLQEALVYNPNNEPWTLADHRARGTRLIEQPPNTPEGHRATWVWLSPIPPTPLHSSW